MSVYVYVYMYIYINTASARVHAQLPHSQLPLLDLCKTALVLFLGKQH